MKKCKWAGDVNDEYCKSCDGITMGVDENSISCEKCAGYEESDEDVATEDVDMTPTDADKQVVEDAAKHLNKDSKSDPLTKNEEKTGEKQAKPKNPNKCTSKPKNSKTEEKNKATNNKTAVVKVSEERHKEEESEYTSTGIKVTSLRYTSGATIKKGDNYFKFTAEEEWSTALYNGDIQDVREQLWAKLNAEVDAQIEELNSMN